MLEARASEDSCTAKKIWSFNPLENFGGHVTVRPSVRPHHRVASKCEISHCLVWEPAP